MGKKIKWQDYVPLGIQADTLMTQLGLLVGIGGICSVSFLFRYGNAYGNLFVYRGAKRMLSGTRMEPFATLMDGVFLPMVLVMLSMPVTAVLLYYSHYQGSRSIYTMRRLPDPWQLPKRCITMPAIYLAISVLVTLILWGVYYLIWRYVTPVGCLPI